MDNTEIYYFSGTGNSLVVARDIAERMEGDLISIASQMDKERITTDADIIGIVFPVYYLGTVNIPLLVQRFVMKLDNISTKYIFAVCTYGGGSGSTLNLLDEMIQARGGRLASGFGVQMPQNAFRKPLENKTKLYNKWKQKKIDFIYGKVNAKNEGWFDTDGLFIRLFLNILQVMMNLDFLKPFFINSMKNTAKVSKDSCLTMDELIPLMDNSYHTDENCTGCSTCSNICPVRNIKIVDNKPVWQHHCENCLACIKWCPQKAIHGYGELPQGYHHPDVTISDMLRQD
jgi:flavodoxin/Pyruvate/2-oxoacid:ferredoxin oxidoreductase delta subunit